MVVFPPAKVNLGLRVTSKRPDGYHNIDSVFVKVDWCDILEIIPCQNGETQDIFTTSGLEIPGEQENNLILKAVQLFRSMVNFPFVKIHLHKQIPMGAGLGGGSADGTYTLILLNDLFDLKKNADELKELALQLGSDCPFFVEKEPCKVTGRGEEIHPIDLNLGEYSFFLINPGIHIGTAEAYAAITPASIDQDCAQIVCTIPIADWKKSLFNDFETALAPKYPEITTIKELLYSQGALYASMTGSGSTLYGIFSKHRDTTLLEEICKKKNWACKKA